MLQHFCCIATSKKMEPCSKRVPRALAEMREYAAIRDIVNVNISDGTQFLSNIASLVIKQMNPTTHGNMVCLGLFKLN